MVWINRKSIFPDIVDKAFALQLRLTTRMTRRAKALKITKPKQVGIASMRDNVIGDIRRDYFALGEMHHAQWVHF